MVTIGGPVTETVFALGMGKHVIAKDQSSIYPPDLLLGLEDVGYIRSINAEGVLSINPSLILTTKSLGPKVAAKQLLNSGVPIHQTEKMIDLESTIESIRVIGEILDQRDRSENLIEEIQMNIDQAKSLYANKKKPSVLFLMNHGGNTQAAGKGTKGHGILTLSGGENMFSDFRGYKPVSKEALLTTYPDVILVATMNPHLAGNNSKEILEKINLGILADLPDLRVYAIEMSYYMSFGPRTGQAVLDLTQKLFPKQSL